MAQAQGSLGRVVPQGMIPPGCAPKRQRWQAGRRGAGEHLRPLQAAAKTAVCRDGDTGCHRRHRSGKRPWRTSSRNQHATGNVI